MVERALQVAEGDVGVDAEAFDLVEDGRVGGVGGLIAVDLAGDDQAQRRGLLQHGADLHGRGVGAHQQACVFRFGLLISEDEGVLRIARGVVGWEVERLEVVEVGLDLGTKGDGVAEALEDADDLGGGADEGVLGAEAWGDAGEGYIECAELRA